MGQGASTMPNSQYRNLHGPSSVERACDITRSLFNAARGHHATDSQTVDAIARRAQLSPAAVRRFLQPSRHPKDVTLGVWGRLVAAYRRYLQQELAALETEIARLEACDPDERAMVALLDEAEALARKIRASLQEVPRAPKD